MAIANAASDKRLTFCPANIYYEALKPALEKREKEAWKRHD